MNTSHVGTNGTTGERGQSEQGQPRRKVVRGAEMPSESGYRDPDHLLTSDLNRASGQSPRETPAAEIGDGTKQTVFR